ncbi:MAG: GGDEF domain-containing protein [Aeromonas sp.]
MQLDRLDISPSHYRNLNWEHRIHIALLAGSMLMIIIVHLLFLSHLSLKELHPISISFEAINWLTMLFLFWVVQCANVPNRTYRLLSSGMMLWLLGATLDVMDEIVAQPLWIAIYAEDLLRTSGVLVTCFGMLSTMHHLFIINSQLKAQALLDELTQLPNRRYFQQQLNIDPDCPLGLILLDLDHFKQINDRFGHDTGDRVLRQFGIMLNQYCPPEALAARIGGEEFALLLPATNATMLQQLADTLLQATQSIPLSSDKSLTVSIGLGFRLDGEHNAQLFKRVDQALYRAKESGRNCYVWAH